MSIIRGPRPQSRFTMVSNAIVQRRDMSRRAKGLLVELLSHRDGWSTDSTALAEAGPEGRDAIRTTLRELEEHRYLVRIKRQDARGRWRTDSYVFDEPVPPGYDPVELLAGPDDPDDTGLSTGSDDRDDLDGDQYEPLFDSTAFAQVAPETGSQAPVTPTPENPASVHPTVGFSGGSNKTTENTPVVTEGGKPQVARDTPPPPGEIPGSIAPAPPGRLPGWDEYGPIEPRCPEHVGRLDDPPCRRCAETRERWQVAEPQRAAARRRAISQAEIQADRRERALKAPPETARAALERARQQLSASKTPAPPSPGASQAPSETQAPVQQPRGASPGPDEPQEAP